MFGRTKQQALAAIANNRNRKGRRRVSGGGNSNTPVVPVGPLRQVATGTFINDAQHPNNTQCNARSPHYMRASAPTIQVLLGNWYVVSQTETNGTGTHTWKAALEYPAGTYTQITFDGGSTSGTTGPGAQILSDPVAAPPLGAKFWIRMFLTTTGRTQYFGWYAGDGTAQLEGAVSGLTDKTMGGTSTTVASANAGMLTPLAIIANSNVPAVGIYGDSISVGRGDSDGAGRALQSHLGRSFGATYPAGHIGVSGDRIQPFLTSNSKRIALAQYYSHIAINFGINDVTGGRSAAQVQADTNSMIGLFGSKPVAVCTLSPVSTGSWTTVGAQTTVASNSVRAAVNTQRLSNLPLARVVYDVNPIVENILSPEDGLWNIVGGANTDDGTHHNANSASRIAASINTSQLINGVVTVARPSINTPYAVGSPVGYTTTETVTGQQWQLDGVNVSTAATYTQAFADSAKLLTLTITTANGSSTSYPAMPGVSNLKLSNTTNLRAMMAGGGGTVITLGDSYLAGFLSGGTNETDMRDKCVSAKTAGKLSALGYPASKDTSAGSGSRGTTPALYTAMDPRWVFTNATVLNNVPEYRTMGCFLFGLAGNTATAVFTPANAFDTVDIIHAVSSTATGAFDVVVGGTTIQTVQIAAAAPGTKITTVTVPGGTTALTLRGVSGTAFFVGLKTRVAATPKIELINGSITGITVNFNATTPVYNVTGLAYLAFVPREVLKQVATLNGKVVLILNGWYNDRGASRTIDQIKADYKLICDDATARGWDIGYYGYPALDTASIPRADFDSFESQVVAYLRDTYNAFILQASCVFTDYATYQAQGFYGDNLHINGNGTDKTSDTLSTVFKLAATSNAVAA